ncbi:peptidase M50 [Clostridium sp. CAG:465]|nr:peptidase M50 [Clostridium sp. CAG:465]
MFNIFSKEGLISFLYTLPALLFCLSVHEFAHAYTAYKLGDRTQKAMGRLTLNPFSHIDIAGFICIALFGFGWGKPVMIDDRNFKNKAAGNALTAFAGPFSNIIMAILFTIILKILLITGVILPTMNSVVGSIILNMFILTIQFNVVFAIFNLIPIPPFDGSRILYFFLPAKGREYMYKIEQYSFVIVLVILVTGIGSKLVSPIVSFVLGLLSKFIML